METTQAPLIAIRQAPTGFVLAMLWLSGEEGESDNEFNTPDRSEHIERGPHGYQRLLAIVKAWKAEFPGARVESDLPIPDGEEPAPDISDLAETQELHSFDGPDVRELPLGAIVIERNYRRQMTDESLQSLVANIRQVGIVQPLVVRPLEGQPGNFGLVAGGRRYRAAQLAGLGTAPCIVRPMTREQALEIQLTENIQREDPNPIDEAEAFRLGMQELGWTREFIMQRFERSEGYVSERLGLLEIAAPLPNVALAVAGGELSIRTAMTLRPLLPPAGVQPGETLRLLAARMLEEEWPAARAAGLTREMMMRLSRSLEPLREQPSSISEPALAMFRQAECARCPYLHESRGEPAGRCLNPPCWEAKQQAAYQAWRAAAEQRVARATTREPEPAPPPLTRVSPPERTAQPTFEPQPVAAVPPAPSPQPPAAPAPAAPPAAPAPAQVAAPPAVPETPSPPPAAVVSADAGPLADLARPLWPQDLQGYEVVLDVEAAVPLEAILGHWKARLAVGPGLPRALGIVKIHIPEQRVWIEGREAQVVKPADQYRPEELAIVVDGARLTVQCVAGRVEGINDGMPAYYRAAVYSGQGGSRRILRQQVVINDGARHIVVNGTDTITIHQSRLPALEELLRTLPVLPA